MLKVAPSFVAWMPLGWSVSPWRPGAPAAGLDPGEGTRPRRREALAGVAPAVERGVLCTPRGFGQGRGERLAVGADQDVPAVWMVSTHSLESRMVTQGTPKK